MSEQWKLQEAERERDRLKKKLLSGELSAGSFLDGISHLDQSSILRTDAAANIGLLEDPDVKRLLEIDEDTKREYANFLSLSYFHIGQRLIESDAPTALTTFKAARSAAEQIQDEAYADWKVYIDATIAYVRRDTVGLEAAHALLGEGANKEIAESLIQGLKERGEIDYRHDYRRVITENGLTVKEEQDILKASEEAERGINVTGPMSVEGAIAYLHKGRNED